MRESVRWAIAFGQTVRVCNLAVRTIELEQPHAMVIFNPAFDHRDSVD
jgi:hypothetical protein